MNSFSKQLGRKVLSLLPEFSITSRKEGFKISLISSHSVDAKIFFNLYEKSTVDFLTRNIRPGDVAVDVGANIGYISLIIGSIVGRGGKVHSFEPSDWTYERLRSNVALNGFGWVETHRAAVGSDNLTSVPMTLPRGYRLDGSFTHSSQMVPLVSLDALLGASERLNFIKTDTDGHEPAVLFGARDLLARHKPLIIFEAAPHCYVDDGPKLKELTAFLQSLNYQFEEDTGAPIADIGGRIGGIPAGQSINVVARHA
jgi:FkbM family methyltransferase